MADLPNCPLCDTPPTHDTRAGWAWCDNRKCTFHMLAPAREPQWRALAALRKPLTEQEADALIGPAMEALGDRALAVVAEGMRLGRTLSKAELEVLPGKAEATAAVQRIVDELTGKKP